MKKDLSKIAKNIVSGYYESDYDDRIVYITIETENEAFQDGNRYIELSRILKKLAEDLESGKTVRTLMDINGNSVGVFQEH